MTVSALPKLFYDACDEDSVRFDLSKPFVRDGFVWATDGRIMVRTPEDRVEESALASLRNGDRKLPNPHDVWRPSGSIAIDLPPSVVTEITCPKCEGEEYTECYSCNGLRKEIVFEGVMCGHVMLAPRYLACLINYGVKKVYATSDPHHPVYFSDTLLEGLLMPMKQENRS